MSDTITARVPFHEKAAWQKIARAVGEDLSEFARKALRQRSIQDYGNRVVQESVPGHGFLPIN